jgi:hypothetical protein
MTALLIGYAVAITIVFFASRTFSINRPRKTFEAPAHQRCTDKRDEFPPPHSITSSARAMTDAGISRPIAFAVLPMR